MPRIIHQLGQWQLWAHYLALTVVLFIAHGFSGPLEAMVTGIWTSYIPLFLYYFGWFAAGDILIHTLFYYAPMPIKWRD